LLSGTFYNSFDARSTIAVAVHESDLSPPINLIVN